MYENTPFDNFNVTHASTRNHEVTITFMENQEKELINTEKMKVDEHALVLIKNRLYHWCLINIYLFLIEIDCTIVYSILKLWEITSFYNSNITNEVRNKYQVTFIFNENQGKSLNNTEQMAFDKHKLLKKIHTDQH